MLLVGLICHICHYFQWTYCYLQLSATIEITINCDPTFQ